ncbi:hypothetical protein FQN54_008104 [Arachnomyces sp. PD_36]|nr:hypothetical protein FQN54_008104 [Arachnomyces sp. PD_36]
MRSSASSPEKTFTSHVKSEGIRKTVDFKMTCFLNQLRVTYEPSPGICTLAGAAQEITILRSSLESVLSGRLILWRSGKMPILSVPRKHPGDEKYLRIESALPPEPGQKASRYRITADSGHITIPTDVVEATFGGRVLDMEDPELRASPQSPPQPVELPISVIRARSFTTPDTLYCLDETFAPSMQPHLASRGYSRGYRDIPSSRLTFAAHDSRSEGSPVVTDASFRSLQSTCRKDMVQWRRRITTTSLTEVELEAYIECDMASRLGNYGTIWLDGTMNYTVLGEPWPVRLVDFSWRDDWWGTLHLVIGGKGTTNGVRYDVTLEMLNLGRLEELGIDIGIPSQSEEHPHI